MALFHIHVSGRSGKSGVARFAYVSRLNGWSKREDFVLSESGNMPSFAGGDPAKFWAAAHKFERANGREYTEIEASFPRELSESGRLELMRRFIAEELPALPYSAGMHLKKAVDGGDNPHFHCMFSSRELDSVERPPEQFFARHNGKDPARGGAKKAPRWNNKFVVQDIRQSWAQMCNAALLREGIAMQVDCRSLRDQGVAREPGQHEGPKLSYVKRQVRELSEQKMAADAERIRPETAKEAPAANPPAPAEIELQARIKRIVRELFEPHIAAQNRQLAELQAQIDELVAEAPAPEPSPAMAEFRHNTEMIQQLREMAMAKPEEDRKPIVDSDAVAEARREYNRGLRVGIQDRPAPARRSIPGNGGMSPAELSQAWAKHNSGRKGPGK